MVPSPLFQVAIENRGGASRLVQGVIYANGTAVARTDVYEDAHDATLAGEKMIAEIEAQREQAGHS